MVYCSHTHMSVQCPFSVTAPAAPPAPHSNAPRAHAGMPLPCDSGCRPRRPLERPGDASPQPPTLQQHIFVFTTRTHACLHACMHGGRNLAVHLDLFRSIFSAVYSSAAARFAVPSPGAPHPSHPEPHTAPLPLYSGADPHPRLPRALPPTGPSGPGRERRGPAEPTSRWIHTSRLAPPLQVLRLCAEIPCMFFGPLTIQFRSARGQGEGGTREGRLRTWSSA